MARSQLKALFSEVNAAAETETNDVMVGGVDSMESACLDVEEANREVLSIESNIEDLEDIAIGIESITESLEASLERGGLDAVAAQFAHHAVDAHVSRLGMNAEDQIPSLESFGGDTGRESATTISLEGVKETLKNIWNAIKAAVEKAIKAVADFFAKIFGGVDKIEDRIRALKKEVAEIKSSNKEVKAKAKVKVGSANTIKLDNKVDGASLIKGMGNLEAVNKGVFGTTVATISAVYKVQAEEIEALEKKDDEAEADKAQESIMDASGKVIAEVKKEQGQIVPGDKTFVTTTKDGDDEETFTFTDAKGAKSFSGSNEIDVLSASDMEAILDEAEKAVAHLKNAKDDVKKVNEAREDALKASKKVVDASDRGKVGKVWTNAKAQRVLRSTQKDMMKPVTQLASHNFSVLRGMLAVVESSTKQYESKDDEK